MSSEKSLTSPCPVALQGDYKICGLLLAMVIQYFLGYWPQCAREHASALLLFSVLILHKNLASTEVEKKFRHTHPEIY